jgi:hypothetical protein
MPQGRWRITAVASMDDDVSLHLQQISSKISLAGCNA